MDELMIKEKSMKVIIHGRIGPRGGIFSICVKMSRRQLSIDRCSPRHKITRSVELGLNLIIEGKRISKQEQNIEFIYHVSVNTFTSSPCRILNLFISIVEKIIFYFLYLSSLTRSPPFPIMAPEEEIHHGTRQWKD